MPSASLARYGPEHFREVAEPFLALLKRCPTPSAARHRLHEEISREQYFRYQEPVAGISAALYTVRDAARAFRGMLNKRAEQRLGFSMAEILWQTARGEVRPDLSPAFWADLTHLFLAVSGQAEVRPLVPGELTAPLSGREAAIERSRRLDLLWEQVRGRLEKYPCGLEPEHVARRRERERRIRRILGASAREFEDWKWQVTRVLKRLEDLDSVVPLSPEEREAIAQMTGHALPFGVTPYYATLMDQAPAVGRDRAIRAQVIPTLDYVRQMVTNRGNRQCAFDFMLERDTSPVDLITRRYPAIAILKPYNTCPQICVYCQRNWEIEEAMAPGALAAPEFQEQALRWIREHPSIREVLVTGGDPLALPDEVLIPLLEQIAAIPHVDLIRIGTRTLVTLPMRITPTLARHLGRLRSPGRREVCVVTHVQHPYEVTPRMVRATNLLRRQGIPVLNQMVFTLFVSRRFEAASLRMILRRIGIDPYYTFLPKGKEELQDYRVPLARLIQEQTEEARLLPGSRRTDEAVYNVPGLGKNYIRASQHRDLIGILPDGSRVYEFHPWEKGISSMDSYVGRDVPLLEYLERLRDLGEDPDEYHTIWYYY